MRCPFCQNPETDVLDTRKLSEGETIRRRRRCRVCHRRFTTYERVVLNLTVIKKNLEREPYDREKLARGVRTACYRRPVAAERIEQLVNDVEAILLEQERNEVPSSTIGDEVMRHLRELDEVAYIRFASVYLSFADIGKLREAVEDLMQRKQASS
jgi:transcriptional repressor NrdR